ncbi:MAG: FtsX-like permease family protein [Pirellulales bacterium]
MAEGLLIGIVAAILSVGFGTIIGWCGCEFTQYISFFGGMHPDLVVPWTPILAGIAALLGLMILTAVWPAWDIGHTKPLTLLQRGRGAF